MAVRGSRLTLALLFGVVVVVLLGTVAALTVSGAQRRSVAGAVAVSSVRQQAPAATAANTRLAPSPVSAGLQSPASQLPASQSPASQSPAGQTAADQSPAGQPPISQSSASQPPMGPSNNQTVELSAAARSQPRSDQVQQLLQAYFDAINNHDYEAWSDVVSTAQTKKQDSARWLQAYASTVDSSIWVQSLSASPLRVALRFTSEQDPDLAPPDLQVGCIDWALTYRIEQQGDQLVVGSTVPNTVSRTRCS